MKIFSKILNFKKKLETPFETINNIYISKGAILDNLKLFQELSPNCSILPVLKSNAYGHWIKQIASILSKTKLDYIVVDSYFEALKVMEVNSTPVLIIGYTLPSNLQNIDFDKITLVIYDYTTLEELAKIGKKVKIHLKLDTGMHRQWIYFEELKNFTDFIKNNKNIILEWVCTHFADADNDTSNEYSLNQLEEFQKWVVFLKSKGFKLKYIHSNNTAWLSKNFCANTCNSSRLGIGLYWVNPLNTNDTDFYKLNNLKLALTFESRVVQVKNIKKWDKVSYNWIYEAPQDMTIWIVPVGYYEWINRQISFNNTISSESKYFYNYKNYKLPVIGRICMNISIIDITWTWIKAWEKIEIITPKNDNNVYLLATKSNTIPYEIFTSLNENIRRSIVK